MPETQSSPASASADEERAAKPAAAAAGDPEGNGYNPKLKTALARAWSQRDRAEPDVIADLCTSLGISELEARAAVLVAKGFDQHPTLAKAKSAADDGFRPVITRYSDIQAKRTEWVWERRIPLGALTLMVGTEGLGKTALGFAFAAALTRGTLAGHLSEPVNVALFTPEDDPARTIRKRLEAAGADLSRVVDVKMRRDSQDRGFSLPGDTPHIARALIENEIRFAFADPLASMLDPRINSWKDTDIREALEPIVAVCAEHGITLLGSLHTNKDKSTDPRQRGMGSAGWRQLARAAFLVGLDPEDPQGAEGSSRCLAHTKHNLGHWTRTIRFELATAPVPVEGELENVVCARLGSECDVRANAMLAAEQGHEGETKEDRALRWLRGFLEDGPKARGVIEQAAEAAGHRWRTVERAKQELGAVAFQPQGARGWSWKLPEEALGF